MVGDGLVTEEEARAALARSLRLRDGTTLQPIEGVDLARGPAFAWSQLALGAGTVLVAVAALLVSRLPRFQALHGTVAIRVLLLALCLLGTAVALRSFRTA
jgi:hypothetical protein